MTIPHLPQHTVSLILSYISLPSHLSQPLPPHLISNSLLQRHHFLALSPQHPESYLCWPSQHSHRAIQLLESLSKQICADEPLIPCNVAYTADDEYAYAHVLLTSQLRIVFQFDGVDTWKYHDVTLMPLQQGSSFEPQDVKNDLDAAGPESECDQDDYWNAYSADDKYRPNFSLVDSTKGEPNSEDAYWAQYVTVQGPFLFPSIRSMRPYIHYLTKARVIPPYPLLFIKIGLSKALQPSNASHLIPKTNRPPQIH
jgi:hypothetical protein